MPTLTATELIGIRYTTGALDAAVWTDVIIQANYDLALVDAPDSTYYLPYTYVYLLRMLWGWQRAQQDRATPHGDRQPRSQISERTKELLDYWEGIAGLYGLSTGGRISVGMLNMDIDWTEDDTDAELLG